MRTPTDYTRLRNRCQHCGHRNVMHTEAGCTVRTKDHDDPDDFNGKECRCGKRNFEA